MTLLGALVVLGLFGFLTHGAQRLFEELGGLLTVQALESDGVNLDLAVCADDDFDGSFHLCLHENEFDCAALLWLPLNEEALFAGFDAGFVDGIQLQELGIFLAHLLFHMTVPPVRCQAEGAVLLLVYRDVIGAVELDHEFTVDFSFVISSGLRVLFDRQAQFFAGRTQGFDVLDLCLDRCEVTHVAVVLSI